MRFFAKPWFWLAVFVAVYIAMREIAKNFGMGYIQ